MNLRPACGNPFELARVPCGVFAPRILLFQRLLEIEDSLLDHLLDGIAQAEEEFADRNLEDDFVCESDEERRQG